MKKLISIVAIAVTIYGSVATADGNANDFSNVINSITGVYYTNATVQQLNDHLTPSRRDAAGVMILDNELKSTNDGKQLKE